MGLHRARHSGDSVDTGWNFRLEPKTAPSYRGSHAKLYRGPSIFSGLVHVRSCSNDFCILAGSFESQVQLASPSFHSLIHHVRRKRKSGNAGKCCRTCFSPFLSCVINFWNFNLRYSSRVMVWNNFVSDLGLYAVESIIWQRCFGSYS